MKKILTVIGARPQFIKASVINRLIQNDYAHLFQEVLVHTGQHYDKMMSDVFFDELQICKPDFNLEIGSGTHGVMTGRMLEHLERVFLKEKPDAVLVYGDTNSTLAGALAASKLHIPVIHIEAGLRSYNKKMPEEQNRVLTDHLSSFLFCPTKAAVSNLDREGIRQNVFHTGDVMLDASLFYSGRDVALPFEVPDDFVLITLHRAENTDSKKRLTDIVNAINRSDGIKGILPLHPRTKKQLNEYGLSFKNHIHVIEPLGYLQMIYLESRCCLVLTDSGGIQRQELFFINRALRCEMKPNGWRRSNLDGIHW